MCKSMLRTLLATCFMLPLLALAQLQTVDYPTPKEGQQYVSFAQKSVKKFIEDGTEFYIDLPLQAVKGQQFDSLFVKFGGYRYDLEELSNFVVTIEDRGDFELEVFAYPKKDPAESAGEGETKAKAKPMKFPGNSKATLEINAYPEHPVFENDAIVFGILLLILGIIFWTSKLQTPFFKKFYTFIPALLLCYFIPAIFNSLDIIDGEFSGLYGVSKNYLLPASLILLCLSIDLKGIINLGPKALIMFFTATVGIIIGAPIALWAMSNWFPELLGGDQPDAVWRGLSTVAGSWIGGGANQTAMKEIAECPDSMFGGMIVVDVFVANIWMAFLLFGAGITKRLDKFLKSDTTAIEALKAKVENYHSSIARIPSFLDLILIGAVAFVGVGFAHVIAEAIQPAFKDVIDVALAEDKESPARFFTSLKSGFFWLIILSTVIGVSLSFTKFKKLEGAGAANVGSVFIYILVATIGMKMDIGWLIDNWSKFAPVLAVGLIWMLVHVILLLTMAKIVKAPFFFVAVGSQANVGGAASAPVVASAFSPSLAPVGVLLAILGYAIGTIAAIVCMEFMHGVSL